MKLGIDFGTSNSAAAAIVDGRLEQVRFGEALQFRTSVYFPETMRELEDFVPDDAQEHRIEQLVESARRAALAAGQARALPALRR
ncbi:MAG: hypothetical protein QM581_14035, partial [Pseudomonas sp.]